MANYSGRGFARRDEIARAKGFSSYNAYRRAPKAEQQRATARLARRNAGYRRTGAAVQAGEAKRRRRELIDLGAAGRAIVSMVDKDLRRFLRHAERDDDRIYARCVIQFPPYRGPPEEQGERRDVAIWSKGGADPSWVLQLADEFGKVRFVIEDQISKVYGLEGAWRLLQIQLLRV